MAGLNVAIAGAGIGGLTAAIALQQRGAHVTVYEKATELKELGAGVVIGMNGERVYERRGLKDSLAAIAGKISGWGPCKPGGTSHSPNGGHPIQLSTPTPCIGHSSRSSCMTH